MATSKREIILTCARELFEREGFHTTGVDRILEEAGVAKMTLYNNFGSKDLLIVEVLKESSLSMISRLQNVAEEAGTTPYEQILGIFQALGDWYANPEFCGCMFQAAVAEFSDHESGPAQAALMHFERVVGLLAELCRNGNFADPEELGRKLGLLASGATCVARQARSRAPADDAMSIAKVLLERARR